MSSHPLLPPYIFQLIDHLYISDHRGHDYLNFFDIIIDTTLIGTPGYVSYVNISPHTLQLKIIPSSTNQGNTLQEACDAILKATAHYKKILLYSDNYLNSASLVYTYFTTKYHFTPLDITRMVSTRPFDEGLNQAFKKVLSQAEASA